VTSQSPSPINPVNGQRLTATWVTPADFAPYGQVITASPDGKSFDPTDAQPNLSQGIPRFYIMRLTAPAQPTRRFHKITRHQRCTQCLGALEGKDWWLGVAPPDLPTAPTEQPNLEQLRAFRIPGNCFIKLHTGTWHAGPYFEHGFVDFYNLELSDTNEVDHQTCNLRQHFGWDYHVDFAPD
jgi:ureidoglycolate hydrolase